MTAFDPSGSAWISQGFERLVKRARTAPQDFDVLIVGSGYGGAIAADTFAGVHHKDGDTDPVAVLERGRSICRARSRPGLRELPRHVRRKQQQGRPVRHSARRRRDDGRRERCRRRLVDQRRRDGRASDDRIRHGLAGSAVEPQHWKPYLRSTRASCSARDKAGVANTILRASARLRRRSTCRSRPSRPTSTFRSGRDHGGDERHDELRQRDARSKCVRCGDCATGCNFGAKNSLDVNLLVSAHAERRRDLQRRDRARRRARRGGQRWVVHCVHTNAKLRARDSQPVTHGSRDRSRARGGHARLDRDPAALEGSRPRRCRTGSASAARRTATC